MTQQLIDPGLTANAILYKTTDTIQTAFQKVNGNFTELYGFPAGSNLFYINTAANPFNADVGMRAATVRFQGYDGTEQFRIDTAVNAVSFVLVRGGIAGSMPVIVSEGTAADIPFSLAGKGLGDIFLGNGAGTNVVIADPSEGVANANYVKLTGRQAGSPPFFSVDGSDGNIDLLLSPKGTGNVRFGTFTNTPATSAGYITVKDAGGTVRKLMVGT